MNYLKVAKDYYLNKKTLKFVSNSQVTSTSSIDVPWWEWVSSSPSIQRYVKTRNKKGVPREIYRTYNVSYVFELNNLRIKSPGTFQAAELSFYDKMKDAQTFIEMGMASWIESNIGGRNLDSIKYRIRINENYINYESAMLERPLLSKSGVAPILGLDFPDYRYAPYNNYSFGILPKQIEIKYRGKVIGKSLAFLFGHWVVLLGDDLTFDSLAALSGTYENGIYVDKFFYTVNPYVVKVIVMSGG